MYSVSMDDDLIVSVELPDDEASDIALLFVGIADLIRTDEKWVKSVVAHGSDLNRVVH
jgi:hypothetical protein